ncbi:NAD(P)H-dependent flavin oxidoreductase [Psychrobacillus lasiicapitis]|uniref:Probable nitronate monooxygenase n=1 Tax=Psychrobacillus lasiicapitis TaxID=1636719 RepID=A0A544T300_9BACI|nr:nitronate monooxygenase [Psychrobacillus lasiicapitis]TQR11827.1 nitronate monooxygenase [Psychrobacillus lasiicapitis]GGA19794.1 2-nitropropane dioxygenase [Psychrobacillus lasiicapitis]
MTKKAIATIKDSLELPVIMAPMFLISNPNMIIKACEAGVVGSFPALNARTSEVLEEWMIQITNELEDLKMKNPNKKIAQWAVNFISHRSNKRYVEDLKLLKKYQPPIVITSLGDPSPVVEVVHEYGGTVLSDVINIKFAKKAIEKGSDGLILVSSGAGGHAGTLNPISFIHEVKEFWAGPIILAGGISKGQDILAAEVLGADFVYMGSRFIATKESLAVDEYKEMVIQSTIEDVLYTDVFSGIHANYLIPSIQKAGLDPSNLKDKNEMDFSAGSNNHHVKAWKDIWGAGQGVGVTKKVQYVSEIIEELHDSYHKAKTAIINDKEQYLLKN